MFSNFNEDRCVMCGTLVPEGRMVCPKCEKESYSASRTGVFKKHSLKDEIADLIDYIIQQKLTMRID